MIPLKNQDQANECTGFDSHARSLPSQKVKAPALEAKTQNDFSVCPVQTAVPLNCFKFMIPVIGKMESSLHYTLQHTGLYLHIHTDHMHNIT